MSELLRMENVSKCFGSFYANQDVNLTVGEGEVHTLLGENGAGKSTLMNVLIGLYQPTEGKIFMHGQEVHVTSPGVAVEHGIGMVHQHFMLIEDMTGLENIILGDKRHKSPLLQVADDRKTVEELMERYGMEIDLDEKVGEMSIGMQQRVEIMKVLFRVHLVILDEPTAVLTDIEVEGLIDVVMRSLTDEGKSIIFISHKMREVMRISDYVTVLRRGKSVKTVKVSDTTEQQLADLMIGQKFVESTYQKVTGASEKAFELKGVSHHPQIKHGGLKDAALHPQGGDPGRRGHRRQRPVRARLPGDRPHQARERRGHWPRRQQDRALQPLCLHRDRPGQHPRGPQQDGPRGRHDHRREPRAQADRVRPLLGRSRRVAQARRH